MTHLAVKKNKDDTELTQVPLTTFPRTQNIDGVSYDTDYPGKERGQMGTCCRPQDCPDRCLERTEAQKCTLEILRPLVVTNEQSIGDSIINFVTFRYDLLGKSSTFVRLVRIMSIPCDYCPLANCIKNCTNGQFASAYSDYTVSAPGCTPVQVHQTNRGCEHRSRVYRPTRWPADRAPQGPGTPACTNPSALGEPFLINSSYSRPRDMCLAGTSQETDQRGRAL